jgi:hypothetical protein
VGYMSHHAIVVIGGYGSFVADARKRAQDLGCAVSDVVCSPVNSVDSFLVAPDGSKEGWGESDMGDRQRAQFVEYLESLIYDDGSSPLRWCVVELPEDANAIAIDCNRKHGKKMR